MAVDQRTASAPVLVSLQVIATVVVAASGMLLYGGGRIEGLAGVIVGLVAYRIAEDRRVEGTLRDRLKDVSVYNAMTPLVELPARAGTPLADARAVYETGAGAISAPEGPRLVLARDVAGMTVERCLAGDWQRVSRPTRAVPAHVRVGDLDQLPPRGEPWVVTVGGVPIGVLSREAIIRVADQLDQRRDDLVARRLR